MRRAARTLGVVVLAALALGALLVGSALTILRTDWGGELARRAALPRINHALAGSVQLQRLRYGGDHLSLEGIVLRDPEGRLVARVRSIEVAFSPLGLLRGQVRVPRLSVVAPALYLRSDPEGLNLARALAPRAPGRPETAEAPATSSGGGGLTVDIGGFRIVDGSVELRVPATATGVRASEPLAASGIAVDGRVRYEAGPAAFEASIRAAADVAKPVRARFDLRIAGHGRGERRRVDLRAGLGESTLAAELQTESEDRATLRGVRLHVVPRLVAAVAPAVGLLAPVDVAADVTRTGPVAEIASDLRSAGAHLEARATVDMGAARARPFAIRASDVDLGRIFAGLPRSDLSLTARGEAQGRDLEQLSGVLELHLPEGRLAGAPVGPIAMIVSANRGQLDIRELRAALPGLTITGHGPAGPARMDLQIAAEALDLGITSRVLSSFPGLGAPPFGGRGRIDLALAGTSRAPAATIRAAFPALRLAEHRVRRLTLEARIPDARTPPVADASLHVVEARLGGRSIRDASIHVRSAPPRLVADVSLKGAAPLALSLSGRWGSDRQSFELDRLRLRYPEATWTSSGRARLSWTPGDLALSGLDLRSGNQRIRASLAQRGARLRAAVGLERVDLGQLPKVAVPPGLTVGGQLDLDGELTGTMRDGLVDPRARLTVSLRNGRVGRTRDLALELEGRYVGRRATGHLEARGLGTSLAGRFDLPMTWPLPDTAAPLALDFSLPETDLAGALEAAGVHLPRRLAGRAAVALRLEGTGRAPVLRLDTTARALVVDGQALGDLSLHVTGGGGAPLQASLDVRGSGQRGRADGVPLIGTGRLDARTDLPLGVLARRPPSAAELTRARFDVTGDLRGVPLAALARLAGSPEVSAGTAALRISASGSARDPRGAVNVELAGAAGPRFPPTDARLDASFGERDTRVALRVTRNARELLSASGILGVGAHRLRDVAALSAAPVTLAAALGPLRLHRDAIAGALDAAGSVPLSTEARARLSVGGTLERPQITMAVTLADARLGTRPLGEARLLATYADRRADADLVIRGPGTTGKLHLTNRTAIDLGYPALMRGGGVDPGHLGLDARLTADHFDLAWLSGITDQVSRVAGQLSATIAAKGPVGAPRVNGQLEWSDGAVGLRGLGDYQQVHLKAHGSGEALVIDELKLASGEGKARLTAQVTRGAAGGNRGLAGQAQVSLSRFPIYGQGQVLALVSADGSAKSDATAAEVNATVTLSEAHVELTDAKQKDLMPLQRPADVVLLDGGRPLDPKEARKLSAVADVLSLGAGAGEPEGASPPPERAPVSPLQAHVAVHAPRNLWVRGKDASLELGLGSSFRVDLGGGGAPRIYGRVLIRRGRLDVLGRRFDLQAGSQVQFVGPADAPRLDVSAKHFNETENVGVLLTVRGTPDKVSVAVSSPERPDLTEGQLYALIVTGRLQFGGNTAGSAGMSGQAASLVGGLVAAQLQKALAKRLPLDVLTLQAGEGLTGSRLEAGTYLTSKLYAGYVGRVGANPALLQNRNAVHLEYQLSRRWSFDGEYGDVGTGTADLVWTKHY